MKENEREVKALCMGLYHGKKKGKLGMRIWFLFIIVGLGVGRE